MDPADALARGDLRSTLVVARLLAIGCAFAGSLPATAGRPLTTEDASVLEHGRCQVESWVDRGDEITDAWLAPACNVGLGIEWQLGLGRTRFAGRWSTSQTYAQAKGLFKEIDEGSPWGVGWVLGVAREPLRETRRGWHDPYVLVPASLAVGEALVHANVGVLRNRAEQRDIVIWGAAFELPAGERLTWVGEAFGESSERPFLRAGARFNIVKDVFDIDLTVVARPGGTREERYISLGVFWQSGRFLP